MGDGDVTVTYRGAARSLFRERLSSISSRLPRCRRSEDGLVVSEIVHPSSAFVSSSAQTCIAVAYNAAFFRVALRPNFDCATEHYIGYTEGSPGHS